MDMGIWRYKISDRWNRRGSYDRAIAIYADSQTSILYILTDFRYMKCQIKFRVISVKYPPIPIEQPEGSKPFAPMVVTVSTSFKVISTDWYFLWLSHFFGFYFSSKAFLYEHSSSHVAS